MAYNTLEVEIADRIAVLTFNRPKVLNAFDAELVTESLAALGALGIDDQVAAIVVRGAGRAFSAGFDLKAGAATAGQRTATEWRAMLQADFDFIMGFWHCPKPTIAAVNGAAIAGGTGLATLCDFTLAVPDAKFGYTEVRIGFVPAIVSTFLLRQVGEKIARDLLLTGRLFDANEAQRIGLVNEIVPPENLMSRARELAAQLMENSPASLRYTKRLLSDAARGELDGQINSAVRENAAIRETADFREGVTSFLEKRKPKWSSQE